MDISWESVAYYVNMTSEEPYILESDIKIFILGKSYSAYQKAAISEDIRSRFWFTYRKGYSPIGGVSGPTSDSGWGCMHRCAQMMIAEALMHIHLGRDWRWHPDRLDSAYFRILRLFEDKESSLFSIHSISSMGLSADKPIGSWLGPNTAAQIIKKLASFERWTNLIVHVTAEDGVIIEEIRAACKKPVPSSPRHPNASSFVARETSSSSDYGDLLLSVPVSREIDHDSVEILLSHPTPDDSVHNCREPHCPTPSDSGHNWRPLLLIIPLRLGLDEINTSYLSSIKNVFELPQSVGIIGGRPNHALWLIGYVGDSGICLDPHVTQPTSQFGVSSPASLDASFHCSTPSRVRLDQLDPSLALAFVCIRESDFEDFCRSVQPNDLFELHHTRPHSLPPPYNADLPSTTGDWSHISLDTNDEFEIIL